MISHTVTSVTTDGVVTILIMGLKKGNRRFWNKNDVITTWTPHIGLMLYTWSFRVGCTVASMDHL